MADANDSKSFGKPCGFESHHRHSIIKQLRIERYWAVFLFLLSFLYFGVFWEDAESFSVVDPLTAWHIACKHRLPYENRCFLQLHFPREIIILIKKAGMLQGQEGKRMARNKTAQGGISLRRKVTAWLAAILLVTMLSTGIATMAGQWTVRSFDMLLADNAVCYTV